MSGPVLDVDLARRRRAELGLSLREVAEAVGMSGSSFTAIENGRAQQELTIGTVVRLAGVLALTLEELVPGAAVPVEQGCTVEVEALPTDNDARVLGSILAAVDTTVPIGALLDLTEWSPSRLRSARAALEGQLATCGMRIRELNAALGLAVASGSAARPHVAKATRLHLARDHVSRIEAGLLRAIGRDAMPKLLSNPERVALGVLIRGELVEAAHADGGVRERPLHLTDDVRFSLLLDERPSTHKQPRQSAIGRRSTKKEPQ
jgi:DNA-binding XRE family transcriptional regulator